MPLPSKCAQWTENSNKGTATVFPARFPANLMPIHISKNIDLSGTFTSVDTQKHCLPLFSLTDMLVLVMYWYRSYL